MTTAPVDDGPSDCGLHPSIGECRTCITLKAAIARELEATEPYYLTVARREAMRAIADEETACAS